jgi:hypothetical protein
MLAGVAPRADRRPEEQASQSHLRKSGAPPAAVGQLTIHIRSLDMPGNFGTQRTLTLSIPDRSHRDRCSWNARAGGFMCRRYPIRTRVWMCPHRGRAGHTICSRISRFGSRQEGQSPTPSDGRSASNADPAQIRRLVFRHTRPVSHVECSGIVTDCNPGGDRDRLSPSRPEVFRIGPIGATTSDEGWPCGGLGAVRDLPGQILKCPTIAGGPIRIGSWPKASDLRGHHAHDTNVVEDGLVRRRRHLGLVRVVPASSDL